MVRSVIAVAWVVTFSALAWTRLDETAREAHKFAWFYGAGVALMVALLAAAVVIWSPGAWDSLASRMVGFAPAVADMPHALAGFTGGLMACAIARVIGYIVVWCGWWIRRR